MEQVVNRHGRALVEQFISGPELTVGLLEEKPLAPIRIVPKSEFFDFHAKYKANDTEHRFDTGLPASVVEECRELARKANGVVGARDLARIDIMIDQRTHKPYVAGDQYAARVHAQEFVARGGESWGDSVWKAGGSACKAGGGTGVGDCDLRFQGGELQFRSPISHTRGSAIRMARLRS